VPAYVSPGDRDLVVVTTLDSQLQRAAETAVRGALDGPGKAAQATQGALVALTHDGAVKAMVGGRDYRASQFNRATQARRQPGSAFKPIVYVAALEAGLRPDSRLLDAPLTIEGWSPRNFKRRHRGTVTLTTAMADSINTIAVRVAERVGRAAVIRVARRLGITAPLKPTPSLALGVGEVSLIELTAAYGAFANGGIGVWAHGIAEIRDADGRALYRRGGSGPGRVLDGRVAADLGTMLGAVIRSGTGRAADFGHPAAGKTGTSQEFRDAWFVGYSADLVAGVWVGNDNGQPMRNVTGGGLPARMWRRFMTAAHAGLAPRSLVAAPAGATAPAFAPDRSTESAPAKPPRGVAPEKGWWDRLMDRLGADGDSDSDRVP
jgi:penicillin-binding protein 1A